MSISSQYESSRDWTAAELIQALGESLAAQSVLSTEMNRLCLLACHEDQLRAFDPQRRAEVGASLHALHNALTDAARQARHCRSPLGHQPDSLRQQGVVEKTDSPLPGGHLCWVYGDREEFRARAREYALEGVKSGEWVECVGESSADTLRAELAADPSLRPALESGVLGTSSVEEFYQCSTNRVVDPEVAVAARVAATEEALAAGYTGFRAVVDATTMVGTDLQRDAFARFEHLIDHKMSALPVTALCAYGLHQLGSSAVAEVACLHPLTNYGTVPLRLYSQQNRDGDGTHLAVAGIIDQPGAKLVTQTLQHALACPPASPGEELMIDAQQLEFINPRALQDLDRSARAHDRKLVLAVPQHLVDRLTDTLDLTHIRVEPPRRSQPALWQQR